VSQSTSVSAQLITAGLPSLQPHLRFDRHPVHVSIGTQPVKSWQRHMRCFCTRQGHLWVGRQECVLV